MVPSPNTSARDVTFSPPPNTVKRWEKFHTWQDITGLSTVASGGRPRTSCIFMLVEPIDRQQVDNTQKFYFPLWHVACRMPSHVHHLGRRLWSAALSVFSSS